jgi:hypothetical protein
MFQSIQEINVYRMRIPVHHHDNGQTNTHFRSRDHHDEEYKDLTVDSRIGVGYGQRMLMHPGERNQQQIDSIQHQFYTHENNDRIAPGEHSRHPNTEQCNGQKYVIVYRHNILIIIF